jgi:hypothetical protein
MCGEGYASPKAVSFIVGCALRTALGLKTLRA